MAFAFDEFPSLVRKLTSPVLRDDPSLRYVCALMAELAYYHVPAFEVDDKKRAKVVVPCQGYRSIAIEGYTTDVLGMLEKIEGGHAFVVIDRGVIAAGIYIDNKIFIGFRGTKLLYNYDLSINLKFSLIESGGGYSRFGPFHCPFSGRVHRGYLEEAVRVSDAISKNVNMLIEKFNLRIENIFLSGHSLGGAVAAIAESFLYRIDGKPSVITFGAPRYCDAVAYQGKIGFLPTQIRRPGDIVPNFPPRSMGYADHPREFDTKGKEYPSNLRDSSKAYLPWRAILFLGKRFKPHDMESYRKELGQTCGAKMASDELIDYKKLCISDMGNRIPLN